MAAPASFHDTLDKAFEPVYTRAHGADEKARAALMPSNSPLAPAYNGKRAYEEELHWVRVAASGESANIDKALLMWRLRDLGVEHTLRTTYQAVNDQYDDAWIMGALGEMAGRITLESRFAQMEEVAQKWVEAHPVISAKSSEEVAAAVDRFKKGVSAQCVVCTDRPVDTAFVACGHLMCAQCTLKLPAVRPIVNAVINHRTYVQRKCSTCRQVGPCTPLYDLEVYTPVSETFVKELVFVPPDQTRASFLKVLEAERAKNHNPYIAALLRPERQSDQEAMVNKLTSGGWRPKMTGEDLIRAVREYSLDCERASTRVMDSMGLDAGQCNRVLLMSPSLHHAMTKGEVETAVRKWNTAAAAAPETGIRLLKLAAMWGYHITARSPSHRTPPLSECAAVANWFMRARPNEFNMVSGSPTESNQTIHLLYTKYATPVFSILPWPIF